MESLPADVVKVDKRFIELGTTSATLLPLIVATAHAFGLPVVVEGVETEEQLAVLRSVHCELAQGFLLSRPMAADAAGHWQAAQVDRVGSAVQ